MKTIKRCCAPLLAFVLLQAPAAFAGLGDPGYINAAPKPGDLSLVAADAQASLYTDNGDYPGVQRAAASLVSDIAAVSGRKPALIHEERAVTRQMVLIGTLGHSALIDRLVATGKLDVSELKDRWDGMLLQVVQQPLPGVETALVIAGANKRGTIYGIYDLSEQIGVSPWNWWADVPVKKSAALYVKANTRVAQAPVVRYRGIFLNDEAPALTNWVKQKYGNYNADFYIHVFELLQRLKGNFLWPAMWNNAFNADDVNNMKLADEMGIVMSTSHHEPMMRAQKEWTWAKDADKGNGQWDYNTNAETLKKFWRFGVERNKSYESIITLGMRGDGDMPMSEAANVSLLQKIVGEQRSIIADVFKKPLPEIPQVWTLYKEVQGYYERGMRVDDDITLLWSDDNWGQIRHLPTPEERKRSGGAGVYYHFDYVGGPRSYRWINTNPISKVWEQMNLAVQYEATRIWVVNVGDLKPMELPIEFFLRMAWDPAAWPKERLPEFSRRWAAREFDPRNSFEIAELMTAALHLNGRRKPELLDASTYSLLNYGEAETVVNEWRDLQQRAEKINQLLPAEQRDAFFQLVLHPIKASRILNEMYYAVARNQLYAAQGRASTAAMAGEARAWFAADHQLQQEFNKLNGGKWNHFMDQTHIGYTNWNNPDNDVMPKVVDSVPSNNSIGVMVAGTAAAWPQNKQLVLRIEQYSQDLRYVELFRRSAKAATVTLAADAPWLQLTRTQVQLTSDQRILLGVDWEHLPAGEHHTLLRVQINNAPGATIEIVASKPDPALMKLAHGFIEADGYIAVEAGSPLAIPLERSGYQWQQIPQYGRTIAGMTPMPLQTTPGSYDRSFTDWQQAPSLNFPLLFTHTGNFTITGLFSPSSPYVFGRGLRYAIALDDEEPQVVDILAGETEKKWEVAVSDAIREGISQHNVKAAGQHTLHIYMVDTGIVLQKLVVNTGGVLSSYLGPTPSRILK